MPKNLLEIIEQYNSTSNPVTKCSLRQCIRDRVEVTHAELGLYKYLGYLITPRYSAVRYA